MISSYQTLNNSVSRLLTIPDTSHMHIALFYSVFAEWQTQNFPEWVCTSRKRLLALSRIKSPCSFHNSIKFLIKHKIIEYKPNFDHYKSTQIKIIFDLESDVNSLLLTQKEPNS